MGLMIMNKLLVVDDKLDIKEGIYDLVFENDCKVKIKGNVEAETFVKNDNNLEFDLEESGKFKFKMVLSLNKDANITFNLNSESFLEFDILIINNGHNKYVININMLGNNGKAVVNAHAINKDSDGILDLICNGYIKKKTINNDLKENLRGLILNSDTIYIRPNMFVDTNEVVANHLVTVSSFNPEELFYLTSRGLNLLSAKKLLASSFIMKYVPEAYQDLVKMEVINNE